MIIDIYWLKTNYPKIYQEWVMHIHNSLFNQDDKEEGAKK
jgi:hypothetical protein